MKLFTPAFAALLKFELPFDPVTIGLIAGAVLLIIIILVTGYLKAPPDTAYIISGLRKKIIIGKSATGQRKDLFSKIFSVGKRFVKNFSSTLNSAAKKIR